MPRGAVARSLEYGVLHEMGEALVVCVFVAAAGVDHDAAVCHAARGAAVNATQPVVEGEEGYFICL